MSYAIKEKALDLAIVFATRCERQDPSFVLDVAAKFERFLSGEGAATDNDKTGAPLTSDDLVRALGKGSR